MKKTTFNLVKRIITIQSNYDTVNRIKNSQNRTKSMESQGELDELSDTLKCKNDFQFYNL